QVVDKFKIGLGYNEASSTAASPAVESFVNLSKMLKNQENNKSKSYKEYHAVPSPYTWNFIPFKLDLTFIDEIVKSENMDVTTIVESNHKKNSFRPPVIEYWNSDDESGVEIIPKDKIISSSTKKIKFVKSASFEHLYYVCDKKVIRPVWNNTSMVNHKNFANKMTHPHPNRRFVPQAVLTNSGKINTTGASVNIAGASVNIVVRPVNTASSKPTGNPQQKEYKEKGVIDSGFSRHMIGNKCYFTEYEDYDGGFVSFGDAKGA
ncbi:hypothetical protein Tco_1267103, partial [Tanacetum coccineum]